jgi:hypothetical protein
MLAEGLTALSSAWAFVSGNDSLKLLVGVAVAGVVLSVIMGLFFRGR